MSLVYDDDERMLLDAARDFLRAESPVSALRALRDSADATGFSRELWASMAVMGWAGLLVRQHKPRSLALELSLRLCVVR